MDQTAASGAVANGNLTAILLGGFVAGAIDISYAIIANLARVAPEKVLQSVASGLLGRAAYQGGAATASLGLFLHFAMTIAMAAIFVAAARSLVPVRQHLHRRRPRLWRPRLFHDALGGRAAVPISRRPAQREPGRTGRPRRRRRPGHRPRHAPLRNALREADLITNRTPSGRKAPSDLRRPIERHEIAAVRIRFQEQPGPPRPGTGPSEGDAAGAEFGHEAPAWGWKAIPFHPHTPLFRHWAALRFVRARKRPPGMY